MEPDDIHGQAAGYVLNALAGDERQAFEDHLVGCTVCKVELESLRSAAAALAFGVELPAPPARLRARILEQVRADRPAVVVPLRRRALLPAAAALAAAAACAAIGLGIWASSLSSSLDRERDARRAETQALAIMATPGAARFPLSGAGGAVVVTPERDAALVVAGLPHAPGGKTYEVWVVDGGAPEPAGLFAGGDRSVIALTRRVPAGARVAVSVEPAGGSPVVTGPMLIRARTS